MSVQELSALHQRYVELSQRFRAAWVYHQFVQSRRKADGGEAPASPHTPRFQALYGELKDASGKLTPGESAELPERFDAIGGEVAELLSVLLEEDSRVPPQALRQFFQKFRNYDDKILAQLTRFYLFACADSDWTPDRRDKVDFLLTRLGDELRRADPLAAGGPDREREIFGSFWGLTGHEEPPDERVTGLVRALAEIREELASVESLDDFTGREALGNYREFKHNLGALLFHPRVLPEVLRTNVAFRDTVRRLYSAEEQRIAADYQRIFDLEREVPVDVQLDQELSLFRRQVEHFERRLENDEMRLDDLTELRERARSLMPRLREQHGRDWSPLAAEEGAEPDDGVAIAARATSAAALEALEAGDEPADEGDAAAPQPPPEIAEAYRELLDALADSTLGTSAQNVVLTPELYPYRLEAREVVAYRRLRERDEPEDPVKERFLLEGAALRVALHGASERVETAADETLGDRHAAEVVAGRSLAALADAYLRRYDHLQEQALLAGRFTEARLLALLRIRLMRDYSELWLRVHDDLRRAEVE